jgi:hypothetical protein
MFYIKEGMHYQQGVENELQNIIKYFVFLQRINFGNPKLHFALCK